MYRIKYQFSIYKQLQTDSSQVSLLSIADYIKHELQFNNFYEPFRNFTACFIIGTRRFITNSTTITNKYSINNLHHFT